MFITIFLIHGCIFLLVKSNPLQGFPSYPIIQYQDSYRNDPPIIVQPNDFNSYPQLRLVQNQVTPYQDIPISYNDLVQVYLRNILQNELNSAINANCCQNCDQIRWNVNPTDIFVPNNVKNYIIEPAQKNLRNKTKDYFNTEGKHQTREKSNIKNYNDDQKQKQKCNKRKNTTSKINEKSDEKTEKCPRHKQISRHEKDNGVNEQSNNQDIKLCRKKKCRNKSLGSATPKEKESSGDNEKLIRDENSNLKLDYNQNNNKKNLNKIEKTPKFISSGDDITETSKRDNNNKNKSNNCRKVIKNDHCHDLCRVLELDDYFNIDEDCAALDNRCTRNYKEDDFKKHQQQQHTSRDFTNNMAAYNMFNPQVFDTNAYYDYLYNVQQFLNGNSNPPQKTPNNNQRTSRRKTKKKGNKKNCDQNMQDSEKSSGCEKIEELSPAVVDVAVDSKPTSSITAKIDETQVEKPHQDVPDILNKEKIDIKLGIHENSKAISPNNGFNWNHEKPSSFYTDYYPVFHDVYTSKEEFDWNNFNERHYYSSEMTELDREWGKYDSTNDVPITQQDNIIKPNNLKPLIYNQMDKENDKKEPFRINNKEENDNSKLKASSEVIQFITPPALDFPDFKTEMINKEKHIPRTDIFYQPNKEINNLTYTKTPSYSDSKTAESNENRNKVDHQNDVVTDSGHSRVIKYGAQPNKGENIGSDKINDSENTGKENKFPYTSDGKTTIVIAKSLPYPI